MENNSLFLGRGWAFPPRFDFDNNMPVMVSEEDDICESLRIILSTAKGERYMNPKFGCELSSLIFDNIDSTLINRIKDYITTAVLNFEPRITLDDISIYIPTEHEGRIDVKLEYTIRKINIRSNIVYPFYFKEGTNIQNM
jgi:phage baseplate assembly protein W